MRVAAQTFRLIAAVTFSVCTTPLLSGTPEEDFSQVRPLLAKYCFKCHSADSEESDLNLARFETFEQANAERKVWETVQGRFFAREMPPDHSPQPNDQERNQIRHWLSEMAKHEGDCNQIQTDRNTNFYRGHVMSRRITRTEYAYSLRDLLGVEFPVAERLPSDGSGGEGFDAVGDSLFLSPIHLEQYLNCAEIVTSILWPEEFPADEPALLKARREAIGGHTLQEGENGREVASRTISALARRAFRRPVTTEEIERYLAFYDRSRERGESHRAGLRLALQGVLISPNFLFLSEPEPEEEGVYALPDFPLAARLAAFLWSSLPDDELLAAAEAGLLQQDEELRKQVRRMLKDPRANALGTNFAMQWLGLIPLGGTVRPDAQAFPEFDQELAQDMKNETAQFFANLFREDRSLLDLLDSDYTYLNSRLAEHYGIPDVTGEEMRQVKLSDRNRGGILTQASVLTVSSYPLRTSPVLRGRWLLEEILGSRVPPPPPGVPALEESTKGADNLTLREKLDLHRSNPQCASCHSRMDPLGFGLENFDPLGRWRTEQNGKPIDSAGVLPSGEAFNGPAELKSILMNRKDDVIKHLARKMYGFAVGRKLNKFDDCVIQDAVAALQQNDYRAPVLAETIVLSYPFRHRYCKK